MKVNNDATVEAAKHLSLLPIAQSPAENILFHFQNMLLFSMVYLCNERILEIC